MALIEQTILRGPDGTRWVVNTLAEGGRLVTTARRTGCDLQPAATVATSSREEALRAHARQCETIQTTGQPLTG